MKNGQASSRSACRNSSGWQLNDAESLFRLPFNDLLFKAQSVHREYFDPNRIQVSTLLSIKTGTCPEDCKYCPQSGHYSTGLKKEKLMKVEEVLAKAKRAKESGAGRFCVGGAWKNPPAKDFPYILMIVRGVRELGLESCMTLGSISADQAAALSEAGLDYYNHNLDTSPEFYSSIITTRSFSERIETLHHVRNSGMKICSGGIVGMGESIRDRAALLVQLANLPEPPESVPINRLVKVPGTPLENAPDISDIDFVRCIAAARIMMPKSYVRLSAGRNSMPESTQALAFFAGANSIFFGSKLLTTPNPDESEDIVMLKRLGITFEKQTVETIPDFPAGVNLTPATGNYYEA